MKPRALAIPFGVAFGLLLSWAHFTDPDVIRAMLLLEDFYAFLVMGSAMMVGFAGAHALRVSGAKSLVGGEPISWTRTRPTRNHVVGSVLFGLGWALACTCPGPVAAQLGSGRFAALFVVAGIIGGAALRGWHQSRKTAPVESRSLAAGL